MHKQLKFHYCHGIYIHSSKDNWSIWWHETGEHILRFSMASTIWELKLLRCCFALLSFLLQPWSLSSLLVSSMSLISLPAFLLFGRSARVTRAGGGLLDGSWPEQGLSRILRAGLLFGKVSSLWSDFYCSKGRTGGQWQAFCSPAVFKEENSQAKHSAVLSLGQKPL